MNTFSEVNFNGHHLVGFSWPVISQRTGEEYSVTMTDYGFNCSCVAGLMNRKCKHAKEVYEKLTCDAPVQEYNVC